MTIIDLVGLIKADPSKFLQDDSIFQLRAFLRGFILAKNSEVQGVSEDQKILESVDKAVRRKYCVLPTAHISIEEILDDFEAENAFSKYLEIWFDAN